MRKEIEQMQVTSVEKKQTKKTKNTILNPDLVKLLEFECVRPIQFFRYMHFVSGKNLVWRKEGRKNVCVPIYLILRVYEFKASFSNCINTANCT